MATTRKTAAKSAPETVEAAVQNGTETAAKNYEKAVAYTKDNIEKASTMAFKSYDEAADFNRETLDAFVATSNVLAKGFEEMSRQFAGYAQTMMEDNAAHAKRLFGARSLPEVMDLQATWAKECFDDVVAESTKAQERSVKLFTEVTAPLNSRMNAAFEKFGKPLAG